MAGNPAANSNQWMVQNGVLYLYNGKASIRNWEKHARCCGAGSWFVWEDGWDWDLKTNKI